MRQLTNTGILLAVTEGAQRRHVENLQLSRHRWLLAQVRRAGRIAGCSPASMSRPHRQRLLAWAAR